MKGREGKGWKRRVGFGRKSKTWRGLKKAGKGMGVKERIEEVKDRKGREGKGRKKIHLCINLLINSCILVKNKIKTVIS